MIQPGLRDALDRWLTELGGVSGRSEKTVSAYRADVVEFLGFLQVHEGSALGTAHLGRITTRTMRAWMAHERDRGLSAVTVARDGDHSREQLRDVITDSDLGITGVDYAVAETGSVVVLPRAGLSRLVSVVPPVHVAIVRPQEILESLDDLFLLRAHEFHQRGGDMGSYLNFITGPSRTADIEQTLVVGVHGPKEVHLVLLG